MFRPNCLVTTCNNEINFKTTWVQEQVCLKRKEILFSLLLIIQSLYIIKIAIKWISLNEGNLNLCFTLSSSMCLSGCFEATEPRELDPFSYLTHKKRLFSQACLADVLRREERDKPESFDPFLSTRHPPPYMGPNVWSSACPKHPPQRLPNMFRP